MFPTGYLRDPGNVGSGEIFGGSHVIIGSSNFEADIVIGRFAKVETGDAIHNLDNSATPVIAGVVQRLLQNPMEAGSLIDETLLTSISLVTQGLVTIDGTTGETPTKGATIYAVNAAGSGANFGKGTVTTTNNIATNARFVEKLAGVTDVWLVQLV